MPQHLWGFFPVTVTNYHQLAFLTQPVAALRIELGVSHDLNLVRG
jgi:hypothetical protein